MYNDSTIIPFGKYKGRTLESIPAQYLLFLWDNGIYAETGKPLHEYIKANFTVLETEAKDYIVAHQPK